MSTQTTSKPGQPKDAGYAEPKPNAPGAHDAPNPEAPGNQDSQVAAELPGEEDEAPDDVEPTPPGEHKREPIKDPDPADTKLHA
jgi:hypothetical protein